MSFYEISGFVLSISTLVIIFLLNHGFNSSSKYLHIVVATYMFVVIFVFIVGIWKIIFKI